MTSGAASNRTGRNCNPFGRTTFAGNDAPQGVDAASGTFGKLAACQIFEAAGPGLAHLVLSEAIPVAQSGAILSGWGTTSGSTELPVCRATPWYDPATGKFRVDNDGALSVSTTVHLSSDSSTSYRRLSLVWSPANGSPPLTIATCEKPPASDTSVPVPLQIQIVPNLATGDRFWFVVEYEPDDVSAVALAFPYSWVSLSPA